MEKIEHTIVATNAINMHVASIGEGPAILFLHGFPELWYSWRHQLLSLSSLGYRCIAPDLRGYGDTDAPPSVGDYTVLHIVGDLVGLLDVLGMEQVFLVGHDWGDFVAWYFCVFRPDRVKALVNTSVPYLRRNPQVKTVDGFRALLGNDFYICRFQEPGEIEKLFAKVETTKLVRMLFASWSPKSPRFSEESWPHREPNPPSLPWLSEEDVNYYASKLDTTGFSGGLNYYRNLNRNWELMAPWTDLQIKVPTKFIVGDLDVTRHEFPGLKEYVDDGGLKKDVPGLEEVVILEGVAHFLNQEKPDEVSHHIYEFIKKI